MTALRLATFVAAATLAVFQPHSVFAEDQINAQPGGLAVQGYDVVSYFTEGRPVRGSENIEHVWRDATWRFSTSENRAAFAADPQRFAPRYGGFCAGGMALGSMAPVDPEAFVIIDDRLYLNYDKSTAEEFRQTAAQTISRADENWNDLNN